MLLTRDEAFRFLRECLKATGVRPDAAEPSAEQMVEADLRGHASHGLIRLPTLVQGVQKGIVNPDPRVRVLRDRPTGGLLDGDGGYGAYVGREAMRRAMAKARETGVGVVGVRNAHYTGLLAYFGDMAAEAGLVAVVASGTPPMVHPWGGRSAVFGTSPLCVSLPGKGHPIVLDMATSQGARGKLLNARKKGDSIPEGWAVDAEGNPTTDPGEALAGALSPFGGHKGSGLAFVLSLLTGPLVGVRPRTSFDPSVFPAGITDKGDFFLAFDPELFGPLDRFVEEAERFSEAVRSSPRAPGFEEIRVPGDRAYRTRAERLRTGIPVADAVWEDTRRLAEGLGLPGEIPR
ncbi:MAG: Ldh family oxidoreductase [Nitrospinota bacterium]